MEEKQLEFVRSLYGKYGITDESRINYAAQAFRNDFDGALNAFYSKYNPEKEIDVDYFNQIKSSYFAPIDQVQQQPVSDQSQESAPSGFFDNFANTISNIPEDIAGGFWQVANFIDRGGHIIDKAVYDLTGINMKFDQSILPAQEASGRVGSPNTEYIMGKIAENEQDRLPVKGFTEAEGVGEIASATLNAGVQFLRSMVTGRLTMGAAPIIEQYESMYLDAVEAKAEQLGVNPMQLVVNGQDEDLEPMLYGAAAALLESVGLKGVSKYIDSMPKGMKSEVFKWLYSNAKEGGTEWGQEMLSFLNEERAKGTEMGDALFKAFERGFSSEGAESFIGGFAGAAVIGATGKLLKNAISGEDAAKEETPTEPTPEQKQSVKNRMDATGAAVKAAEAVVETGDAEIDQLVQNTLRETEQALESKLLQEEQDKAKEEARKQEEKEVKKQEAEQKKQESKKEAAQQKVDEAVSKDVSRTVKDKASLKKAVYSFLGVTETKENVDEVNSYVNFFDGIATARSKREGISKEEWYKSRVASIGTTQDANKQTGTSFLEDGRATILALQAGSPRDFFRGFAQVIQRDLNDTESAALEAEFGINFKQDLSDESIDMFGRAFESYMETGVVPEGIKGNNASFVKAAFEKISNWLRDIKSAIQGDSSLYVNSNVRRIFDSIVTGQEIQQEQKQEEVVNTTTEGEVDTNEQSNRQVVNTEQVTGNESVKTGESTQQQTEQQAVDKVEDNFSDLESMDSDQIDRARSDASDKVNSAARNLRTTDPRDKEAYDAAMSEFRKAEDEYNRFDKYQEFKKNKVDVESSVEDERERYEQDGDNYEYKDLYEKDPRLAAIKSAEDMIDFLESEKSNPDTKVDPEKSIPKYKRSIDLLKEDIRKNPLKNEQKTEKKSNEGVLPTPKTTRVRPQADARKRRSDAFEKASKPFEAKPNGGIKGGEAALEDAVKALSAIQSDPEQDALTKEEARVEIERLKSIQDRANENKKLRSEKSERLNKIKSDAVEAGYSKRGINSFFSKSSLVPVEYDNGEVFYFDTETGEIGSYSLSEEKATPVKSKEDWDSKANDRLKREDKRNSDRLMEEARLKEAEERSKIEASKKASLDKESDKANSVYEKTLGENATEKGVAEVIDSVDNIDLDNAFSSNRDGDVSIKTLQNSVKSFIDRFLNSMKNFSSDREMFANAKKFESVRIKLLTFVKNSPLLKEKDRTALIETIESMDKMFLLEIQGQEDRKEKKRLNKIIGDKRKTVLGDRVSVQSVGFNEDISKGLVGMFSDFLRGFGLKRKLIILDSDFFSNNNRPEFKGMSIEQITELRNNEVDRVAAIFSRQKLHISPTKTRESSFFEVKQVIIKQINSSISGDSKGSVSHGDKFSFVVLNTSRKDYARTATHEFGHILEIDLFNKLDENTKKQIIDEWNKWVDLKKKNIKSFTTPSVFDRDRSEVDAGGTANYFGGKFSEYFAEQVSYWALTQEKPSNVVEKFFSDVAKALKKLFERFREDYGVSDSITKLLNDQFSFDGFRATEQQKASRDFIIDESAKVAMSIMDNNRKLVDINASIDGARAKTIEEAKAIAAKKAADRKVKESLEKKNELASAKLDEFYNEYKANGGTMDRDAFNEKINKLADDRLTRKIVSDTLGRLSELYGEDGDGADMDSGPAVDFAKNTLNPRSGDKRKIFMDKLTTALDGKFSNIKEFNKLISQVNKSLSASGEPTISSAEKKKILGNTKSGSIARITLPIYKKILQKKPTKEMIDLVQSFSASRAERDAALAQADAMVKSGNPLTDAELDQFNRLQLVGLFNTTVEERNKILADKVGLAVANAELSKVSNRVAQRANEDRLTIAEAFYESVLGFEKVGEGEYRGKIQGGKVETIKIYDRRKGFSRGDKVEYGGKIYIVKEPIGSFETGFLNKMSQIGSVNKHSTNAELAIEMKKKGFIEKMNSMFLGTHGIESIANMLKSKSKEGSFEGALSKMIGEEGFRRAAMNKRNHNFKVEDMYKALGEKVFGVKGLTAVNKKIYDMKTTLRTIKFEGPNGTPVEVKMTVGEMLTWYAYMGQPDLAAKFKNMEEKFKSMPQDSRFWNKSKGDAIVDALKQEEKDFAKGVITEIMPYVYQTLNKAHMREMGYDLQIIENYFPTKVEVSETDTRQTSVIDTVSANFSKFIASVSNNNIKERRSNNPLRAGDFFGQFMQYSDKAFHYAEYVGPLKKASLLFQNEKYEYSGYFNTVFGKEVIRQIKINLDNIAFGGASRTVGMKHTLADTLRSLNIGGAFMANLTMIPKQVSSFIALADSMSWRDFSKYYITADWKSRIEDLKEIHSMRFMKDRLRQGGRLSYDTQGLMFDALDKELGRSNLSKASETAIAAINKALFSPVMFGDAGAIYLGGMPLLRDLKKRAADKFPSDKVKQKEWVELKFEEAVSRTQQSRDIMDQSDYQTAGSWAQWMVTFMSTPILYGRVLAGSLRDIKNGYESGDKKLMKKGLKTGLMFSTIAPLFFQVASTGGELVMDSLGFGDDEEEDQLRAWKYNVSMIGVSFVQHIPILYPMVQNFVDYVVKGNDFDASISAPMAITEKGYTALRNIIKDVLDGEFDFNEDSTQREINEVSRALGINYKGVKNLGKNWIELFEEGSVEDWRLLLGYSEFAIE